LASLAYLKSEDDQFGIYPVFELGRSRCLDFHGYRINRLLAKITRFERASQSGGLKRHLSFSMKGRYGKKMTKMMDRLSQCVREYGRPNICKASRKFNTNRVSKLDDLWHGSRACCYDYAKPKASSLEGLRNWLKLTTSSPHCQASLSANGFLYVTTTLDEVFK
jgi:hypothetical protein